MDVGIIAATAVELSHPGGHDTLPSLMDSLGISEVEARRAVWELKKAGLVTEERCEEVDRYALRNVTRPAWKCYVCGRSFETEHGLRIHHGRAHGVADNGGE